MHVCVYVVLTIARAESRCNLCMYVYAYVCMHVSMYVVLTIARAESRRDGNSVKNIMEGVPHEDIKNHRRYEAGPKTFLVL